jgi:spore coat protein U-like protein
MKKTLFLTAIIILLAVGSAYAGTATSQFQVTASVAANCTITSTSLGFGPYDPIVNNAASPLNQTGSVSVSCTKGAGIEVGLDVGLYHTNATGTTRAMKETASANYLNYELYLDSGHTTVWNNIAPNWATWTSTGKTAHELTIYGQVPSAQDVAIGSYADTITATVNF